MKARVVLREFKRLEPGITQEYLGQALARKILTHVFERVTRFVRDIPGAIASKALHFFDFVLESLRIEPLVRVGMRGGADLRDCALHLAFEPARF